MTSTEVMSIQEVQASIARSMAEYDARQAKRQAFRLDEHLDRAYGRNLPHPDPIDPLDDSDDYDNDAANF